VDITLLQKPLFYLGHRYVSVLGLIAFVGFFAAGLIIARFLQSQIVRRFFSRFKIDTSFIAIVWRVRKLLKDGRRPVRSSALRRSPVKAA
jgi:hypothetical protein